MSRLAFFGTPEFAASQFEGLISYCQNNGHTIVFAVCQPDRPQGRSQKLLSPPVKNVAVKHQIPVYQPQTLKAGTPDGEAFFQTLRDANLDLAIVVAYGRIIPTRMLALPKRGFVNVHASLLPRWRGASPIQRAIQAGDQETGVSIMDLVPKMDAGDVYEMRSLKILAQDTAGTLTVRLAELGLQTLSSCLESILDGTKPKTAQPEEGITFAPKLEKTEGRIPWQKSAQEIVNHSRAMDPWPQSFAVLNGKTLKLFGAQISSHEKSGEPGTILSLGEQLVVACGIGAVAFTALQFEGRNQMSIRDAQNGKLLREGEHFSTDFASL